MLGILLRVEILVLLIFFQYIVGFRTNILSSAQFVNTILLRIRDILHNFLSFVSLNYYIAVTLYFASISIQRFLLFFI